MYVWGKSRFSQVRTPVYNSFDLYTKRCLFVILANTPFFSPGICARCHSSITLNTWSQPSSTLTACRWTLSSSITAWSTASLPSHHGWSLQWRSWLSQVHITLGLLGQMDWYYAHNSTENRYLWVLCFSSTKSSHSLGVFDLLIMLMTSALVLKRKEWLQLFKHK